MGTRGPVGKRSDQKHGHRTQAELAGTRKAAAGSRRPVDPDPDWHPIARMYWEAVAESGQAVFFERSDWVTLFDALDELSAYKRSERRSAVMRASVDAVLARLLMTEADRRRLRVELERDQAEPDPVEVAAVSKISDARTRLEGQRSG